MKKGLEQTVPSSIDNYIGQFSCEIQEKLIAIRTAITSTAPDAGEKISYGMPTFTLNGNLVHFASCKGHIGFYPTPGAIEVFKHELSAYHTSKGAVQFPLDKPLPLDLVKRMVLFRVSEQIQKGGDSRK